MYQDKPPLSDFSDELYHYGIKRRSGRYPWGSGEEPYQHSGDFLSRVETLQKSGMSEAEIANKIGISTTELRVQKSLANDERRSLQVAQAKSLREHGYSLNEIAKKMGFDNDSSVRSLLDTNSEIRMNQAKNTAEFLKKRLEEYADEGGMIDVGKGAELCSGLGISREKLDQALYMLEREGYPTYSIGMPQVTNPGQQTIMKVLCPKGADYKDAYQIDKIHSLEEYTSHDDGETFEKFHYPASLSSKRVMIKYAEDGGVQMDGVIELRRGVPDLDLGNSRYAQVRILVDGKKYLKGMAIYADDLPDGVDVRFNTNKKKGTPMGDVLKDIKNDPDNPFGSAIKPNGQSYYIDKDGKKKLSCINKRAEEGDWETWSKELPSQFLGKQDLSLIRKQLKLTEADKQAEYDEICSLDNPTVKKRLLKSFADDCDSAAIHLKAAALPRQQYKVILPVTTLKDNEVYAPDYKNGEKVSLIRFPHGGLFEIPQLTVNNKQADAKKMLGNARDGIGINSKVAERLSGADFDGDTVLIIPTNSKVNIKNKPPLQGLEGFDPKMEYGTTKSKDKNGNTVYLNSSGNKVKILGESQKQKEMGIVSNLITDMTLKGASDDELARAVRHSMVVIDATKHKLDYKQSERDNGIAELKKTWQGHIGEDGRYHEGASTLLSQAKSERAVPKRKGSPQINKETGEVSYKLAGESYVDNRGKVQIRTQKSTAMAEAKDAHTLSSGTLKEEAYANYANKMKALANQARKEMLSTGKIPYSNDAAKKYSTEVTHLESQLKIALKNAPKERQAQTLANTVIKAKKNANPDMAKDEIKKASNKALVDARIKVGAKRNPIQISDREWEAIQKGAISETKLMQILNCTDIDDVRQRAMPRTTRSLSPAKVSKAKAMSNSGYTIAEIAESIGCSTSTINKYLN